MIATCGFLVDQCSSKLPSWFKESLLLRGREEMRDKEGKVRKVEPPSAIPAYAPWSNMPRQSTVPRGTASKFDQWSSSCRQYSFEVKTKFKSQQTLVTSRGTP